MQAACAALLTRFIALGRLGVEWPDGRRQVFAGAAGSGPEAAVRLSDTRTMRRLLLNPALGIGEAYMDGGFQPIDCSIYDVLDVLVSNVMANGDPNVFARVLAGFGRLRRRIDQYNPATRAVRNVAHHYDLNGRL